MKKVIDGVTYNTATSTAVAVWQRHADDYNATSKEQTLYQTRGGAFFLHSKETWAAKDADGEWQDKEKNEFSPMTHDQAQKWFMAGEVEVLADVFPEPPEAEAETSASSTIYLRVPVALKTKIEKAAKKADQSVNVWAMRCLEGCAAAPAE